MKPAKPSKKRAGTAPRRRASISKVPPASPAVVAPALFGAAAAPAPQTDAAAAGGGTVLPLIHNGVAAPAPAMQGDTLHPSPPPASRRAPSRSGTRSRARPRSRAAVAVVTISAASQAPAFPPPPMAFELSAAGATQSTPLSAVAAATIPLPASPGAAGGAAVPSPRAARAVLHAAVTVGTALAAMSPQHAGGGGAFPLSSSPPGAPGAAAPQPSPSAVAAAAASSPAAASAEPLVPSPPPPHRPASAARRINRSPRPSVPGGASKAKGKGGGATTAAAAAATAVAAKSAPVAGAGALFKLLSLSDVVDVMGKAPEGRRTMPNLIDLSINPSLQLPDLVCNTRQTPGVTRTGALYVAAGSTLFSFAPDGAELPTIAMPDLGLSEKTFSAVCDPLRKTVILADANADESRLVAMRRDSKTVAWSTARGSMHFCHGLAILPVQNLVLASSYYGNCVQAYQTSDGSKCGEIGVFEPTFLAADPGSATIFAATFKEGCGSVAAFQWRGTTGLTPLHATVEAAGVTPARRPLALMPPTHGPGSSAGRAFLVVGTQKSSELRVLALPALTLVHTHVLPGVQVQGLGADSARYAAGGVGSGGDEEAPATPALIVLDSASGDVLVLPWPLPGMPLLDY